MQNKKTPIPLDCATEGQYRVVSLSGGRGFLRRLADFGIYPGAFIEVLPPAPAGGPVRVMVRGSQFGLGRGMAKKILVIQAYPPLEIIEREKLYTLRDYREGERGKIIAINGSGKFKKRLLEMGFVKGVEVYVEKYAPLRDPVEFVIKGYHVSLRMDEAEKIIMTPPQKV